MLAVDTNILVYAHREDATSHAEADRVLAELAEGAQAWAIPWACVHEFLAIATHPRIYDPPTPVGDALEQVRCWLESPSLALLGEGKAYLETLADLLERAPATGGRLHDARIAALCQYHGVRKLLSADRDFGRFPDLRVENPLTRNR